MYISRDISIKKDKRRRERSLMCYGFSVQSSKHCRQVYVLYFVVTQASKSVLVLLLKAAIARCGSSTFHILPPQSEECSNFSHAVLLYECGRSGPGDCNQMAGTSGEGVFCTVS